MLLNRTGVTITAKGHFFSLEPVYSQSYYCCLEPVLILLLRARLTISVKSISYHFCLTIQWLYSTHLTLLLFRAYLTIALKNPSFYYCFLRVVLLLPIYHITVRACSIIIPAFFFRKKGYINFVSKSVRRPSICPSVPHVSCKCISS